MAKATIQLDNYNESGGFSSHIQVADSYRERDRKRMAELNEEIRKEAWIKANSTDFDKRKKRKRS